VATHWLRHPPGAYTVSELDELVVLSLFHDIHYYGAARPQSLARNMRLQRDDALRDIPGAVLQPAIVASDMFRNSNSHVSDVVATLCGCGAAIASRPLHAFGVLGAA
jgi:hypothetical protein